VGYVRISVDRENETSTDSQEERIRAYCAAQGTHGWPVVDLIVEPGRSAYRASRSSRPGFRRAMRLVQSGAADVLVVWKLDRAARNTEDTLALVRELAEHGAQFASVTEHFDTSTASGRMMLTVLSALAEMESATKSERVVAWQAHRRTNGAPPTGPRRFGYQRDPEQRNRLFIVKDEARTIRQAAKRVLAGDSVRSIAADLARAGVTGSQGMLMTRRTLCQILLSPTIAACREVDGAFIQSDGWEPILDLTTWNKVRAVLNDPARRSGPGNSRRWWLTGIATCGRCPDVGMRVMVTPKRSRSGPRYFCPKCYLSIQATRTDELVEDALLSLLDRKAWRRLRQGQPVGDSTAGFEEAMQELTARFVAGDLSGDEMGRLAEALRQEVADRPPPPSLPDVDDLKKAWPTLDLEARRLVLSAATVSLTIGPWDHKHGFDDERIQWVPVA
jgi:DNA invertase Pin-like site-specific DNA recombinase